MMLVMADTVDSATRSRMMPAIHGQWTLPERVVAGILRRLKERYHTHDARLPGRPDFVLPEHRAVIRVQGCFWHMHGCDYARTPRTRTEFWARKFAANRARDEATVIALVAARWRVLTVWECALRGSRRWSEADLELLIGDWLTCDEACDEISGRS
jgi:DNA mismatch endonuclease (patch repair protein)